MTYQANSLTCSTNKWAKQVTTGTAPNQLSAHTMVEYQNEFYISGGFVEDFLGTTYTFQNKLFKYNINTAVWSLLWSGSGTGPSKRAFHGSIFVGNELYIYGGSTFDWGYTNITVDGTFWKWKSSSGWTQITATPNPGPRTDFELTVLDGKIYLFAGFVDSSITMKNDLWRYDPSTNAWTQLIADGNSGSPHKRHSHQFRANPDDGYIYMSMGKIGGGVHINDTWVYHPNVNSWADITPTYYNDNINPALDDFYASDFVDGQFILYGGQQGTGGVSGCNAPYPQNPIDKTYLFDPSSQVWTEKPFLSVFPPPLVRHAGAKTIVSNSPDDVYFFVHGGYSFPSCPPGQVWNNDIWCLEIV